MKKIEKKLFDKVAVISIIIVVITMMAGMIFIYLPFEKKNKTLRSSILDERDKNVLIGKIRAYGRHLKIYEKRIPENVNVAWLLDKLSNMASEEQVEISSIKPGTAEDFGLYTKLYASVETVSTYHELGRFISAVESYEKFLKIEKISIKRLDADGVFNKTPGKFKAFDIKANMVISAITLKGNQ